MNLKESLKYIPAVIALSLPGGCKGVESLTCEEIRARIVVVQAHSENCVQPAATGTGGRPGSGIFGRILCLNETKRELAELNEAAVSKKCK